MTITGSDLMNAWQDVENSVYGDCEPIEERPEPDVDEDYKQELEDEARRKEARRANGDRLHAALRGIALSGMEVTAKHGLPSGLGRRKERRDLR